MDKPVTNSNPKDGEGRIIDYLIILAKHSRMIVFVSVAVVVITYLYNFISPDTYKANTRLLPPQQNYTMSAQLLQSLGGGINPAGGDGGGGMGGIAGSLLGLRSSSEIYVAMLTSNNMYDRLIARFDLKKLFKVNYLEDARKAVGGMATISLNRKDGLIAIEVTDKDPQRAAAIANAFIDELDKLLQELAVQEAKDRLAFLEKELSQATFNLAKAEEALRTFSEQKSVIQLDTQTRGMLDYIASLRAVIDSKEVQIKVLRQQATTFNYDVIRLETELKGLKEKLQAAETQWDQTCVGEVCLPTSKTPALGMEYVRLYRQVKFQENLYQLFTKMAEVARLDMVKNVAVVRALDKADQPERRSNQRLKPALKLGALTFFMMIFVVFGLEYLEKIRNREDEDQRWTLLFSYFKPDNEIIKRLKSLSKFGRNS